MTNQALKNIVTIHEQAQWEGDCGYKYYDEFPSKIEITKYDDEKMIIFYTYQDIDKKKHLYALCLDYGSDHEILEVCTTCLKKQICNKNDICKEDCQICKEDEDNFNCCQCYCENSQ